MTPRISIRTCPAMIELTLRRGKYGYAHRNAGEQDPWRQLPD